MRPEWLLVMCREHDDGSLVTLPLVSLPEGCISGSAQVGAKSVQGLIGESCFSHIFRWHLLDLRVGGARARMR
jgi:hypothetical protein